jgi:hypothetical protein
MFGLLDINQAELQLIITLSVLLYYSAHTTLQSHLKSSRADLYSSAAIIHS